MSFDAEHFVHYQIANTNVLSYPFPHFYVHPVFPPDLYAELLLRLPKRESYLRLDETGTVPRGAYPERFICTIEQLMQDESKNYGNFWTDLYKWLMSNAFAHLLMKKFDRYIEERFGQNILNTEFDARLIRDFTNYSITPHTDATHKLISLLFYLPPHFDNLHLGTSIYAPIDPNFRCEGGPHHPYSKFKKVVTAEYKPNSLFAFFKTDNSFHGVDPITDQGIQRDLLLYNIYVRKVVAPQGSNRKKWFKWW